MSVLHELFPINEEIKKTLREKYEKSDLDIAEDLKILRAWLEKQQHLPQDIGIKIPKLVSLKPKELL